MDMCDSADLGCLLGIKILEGRCGSAPPSTRGGRGGGAAAVGASPRGRRRERPRSGSLRRSSAASSRHERSPPCTARRRIVAPMGGSGLNIGRRLMVVAKPDGNPQNCETFWPESQLPSSGVESRNQQQYTVRIVDHGAVQKESVRRLNEAHTLLKSYEEQLLESEMQVKKLREQLLEAGVSSQPKEETKNQGDQPTPNEKAAIVAQMEVRGGAGAAGAKKIPYWLRNDHKSRTAIERERMLLMKEYMTDGHLDSKSVGERLWQCGLEFALRWGGSPDNEIQKQNELIEQRCRKIQRDALQETSMLRQQCKKLEKRYRELQLEFNKLSQQQAEQKAARPGPPSNYGPSRPPAYSYPKSTPQPSLRGCAVAAHVAPQNGKSDGGSGAAAGGRGDGPSSPHSGSVAIDHAQRNSAGGLGVGERRVGRRGRCGGGNGRGVGIGGRGTPESGGDGVGDEQGGYGASEDGIRNTCDNADFEGGGNSYAEEPAGFVSEGVVDGSRRASPPSQLVDECSDITGPVGGLEVSLVDDEILELTIANEELETLDHELHEPLNAFDDDIRELLVDVINEKVRRILSMDSSKFKGGRLPFGLRPDKLDPDTYQKVGRLEAEVEQLKDQLEGFRERTEQTENKLDQANRGVAQMRRQKAMTESQAAERPAGARPPELRRQSSAVPGSSESNCPMGRGARLGSANQKPREEDANQKPREEEIAEAVAHATADLNERIAGLEAQLDAHGIEHEETRSAQAAAAARHKTPRRRVWLDAADDRAGPDEGAEDGGQATEGEGTDCVSLGAKSQMHMVVKATVQSNRVMEGFTSNLGSVLSKVCSVLGLEDEFHKDGVLKLLPDMAKEVSEVEHIKETPPEPKVGDPDPKKADPKKQADNFKKAAPVFDQWSEKVLAALVQLETSMGSGGLARLLEKHVAAQDTDGSVDVAEQQAPTYDALQAQCKRQESEIARLLLTIDELRARIGKLKGVAEKSGMELAGAINGAMSTAGLREIVEAGSGPALRGVFQRLYQDALQRVQRLGLIRAKMVKVKSTYASVASALEDQRPLDYTGSAVLADLDQLSETTDATLAGMWYHTEFLFRHACEYAIAKGAEAYTMKGQKCSLAELIDTAEAEHQDSSAFSRDTPGSTVDDDVGSTKSRRGRGTDRLPPARGSDRHRYPGAPGGDGRVFWHPLPGGLAGGPRDPEAIRKAHLLEPEPSAFAAYVHTLREARGEVLKDGRARRSVKESLRNTSKTLKEACKNGDLLATSRSLPILPKIRTTFQDGEISPSASQFASPLTKTSAVDGYAL